MGFFFFFEEVAKKVLVRTDVKCLALHLGSVQRSRQMRGPLCLGVTATSRIEGKTGWPFKRGKVCASGFAEHLSCATDFGTHRSILHITNIEGSERRSDLPEVTDREREPRSSQVPSLYASQGHPTEQVGRAFWRRWLLTVTGSERWSGVPCEASG